MKSTLETSIVASLSFCFRGRTFTPSIKIDLHQIMEKGQRLENIHHMLAVSMGLDVYRHEYDVLVMEEICFSNATGLACAFVEGHSFDIDAFMYAWQREYALHLLQPIAQKHLNILDLNQHLNIQRALVDAYQMGVKQSVISPAYEEKF